MIQIGDDDLAAPLERLADCKADGPDERRRIEPERYFVGRRGIDQIGDAGSRAGDHRVDFLRSTVGAAALYVARDQMLRHRVERSAGHLRACGVVEEHEGIGGRERRKLAPKFVDGEGLITRRHMVVARGRMRM